MAKTILNVVFVGVLLLSIIHFGITPMIFLVVVLLGTVYGLCRLFIAIVRRLER